VNDVAYSGTASFMLQGRAVVSAPFQPIAAGHEYVLSAMVMVSRPDWVRMGFFGAGGGHYIKEPMKWQKIVFRFKPENRKGFAAFENTASPAVSVELPEGVKVWVDDVDLRVAPEAPYAPRFQKEFAVNTTEPRNVVIAGTPVTFAITCAMWRGAGSTSNAAPATIRADLFQFDEDGRLVGKWHGVGLSLAKGGRGAAPSPQQGAFAIYEGKLDVPSLPNGYWRFVASESPAAGIRNLCGLWGPSSAPPITPDLGEALVAVVPKLTDQTPFSWQLGAHGRMDELWKCGVRWMRLHDASVMTKWHFLEAEKGTWNWAPADAEIDGYRKAGFRLLGLLDGCPGWRRPDGKSSGSAMLYPDTELADWENYVFRTVSHFKGRVDAWEIMNEPIFAGKGPGERSNQQWYVDLQKVAYRAAKRADAECVVVGAGGAGSANVNDGWYEEAIKAGLLENCDVVSYHGYGVANCRTAALGVGSLEAFVRWIKDEAVQRTGKPIPVWDTEVGLTPPTSSKRYTWPQRNFGTSESNVKGSLVGLLGEKSVGVEKTFIYHSFDLALFEDTYDLGNFVDINGQMTPVSQTLAIAQWLTGALVPDEHSQPSPKVNVLGFKSAVPGKMRKVWFIWAAGGETVPVTIKVPHGAKVKVLSVFGRELGFKKDGDNVSVKVIPWPAYVVAE
jgi:hypothetical protein